MINEFFIFVLAYNFFNPEDEKILYAILTKRTEIFPESPTAYGSLAYAYFENKRYDLAIQNYRKVLELDPENKHASRMIKRIQNEE